jgi:hypothetical protein
LAKACCVIPVSNADRERIISMLKKYKLIWGQIWTMTLKKSRYNANLTYRQVSKDQMVNLLLIVPPYNVNQLCSKSKDSKANSEY